jgi:hypothetical protein
MSVALLVFVVLLSPLLSGRATATDAERLSSGETVYVPVYANVFSAPKAIPFPLATILSVRNTDPARSITLTAADYYDTQGKLLRRYVEKAQSLAPLATTTIYLPAEEPGGGVGANFLVRWSAAQSVNAPIVECVMLGTKSGQGISFVSPGQVIREDGK